MPSMWRIKLQEFTEFFANQFPRKGELTEGKVCLLLTRRRMGRGYGKEIRKAAKGKATVQDEAFVECLQLTSEKPPAVITALWRACGWVGRAPEEQKRVVLFPLFRNENTTLPKNYMPIGLLAHIMKLVEKVVD